MEKHIAFEQKSGSVTTPRISSVLGVRHRRDSEAEAAYLELCQEVNVIPSQKPRAYWRIHSLPAPPRRIRTGAGSGFPDEVLPYGPYAEGGTKRVTVNAYERDSSALKACISHYGPSCSVCGFSFESFYGAVGHGFIHVHHLDPSALRRAKHRVDPVTDLQPVCPNCQAIIHMSDPPFSIEEVQELVNK